jgi:hypothetical protein
MDHDLYALAYLSRRNAVEDDSDLASMVRDILAVAREKNLRLGVTGAFLFSHESFAQVLEGSRASVETVFEAIQRDSRHRDINVLYFSPIKERDFGEWTMAFAGMLDEARIPINVDGIHANYDSIAAVASGKHLVKVLKTLIDRQEVAGELNG